MIDVYKRQNLTMALPLGIVNPAAFEGGVEKAYENCVSADVYKRQVYISRLVCVIVPNHSSCFTS